MAFYLGTRYLPWMKFSFVEPSCIQLPRSSTEAKMHNLKATIILFLLGGCLACHSKPSSHESAPAAQVPQQAGISTPQPPTTPQPTEVGMPLGDSVSKEIGPEGGSASSTDGHISVTIPAGVLNKRES